MIINVILGKTIDTQFWIQELQKNKADKILVLDYDYKGETYIENGVSFHSLKSIEIELKNYKDVNFYKSLYGFPGMSQNMASLFRKK